MWRNGRRNGLKIRFREIEVGVRVPSSAPSPREDRQAIAVALEDHDPVGHTAEREGGNRLGGCRTSVSFSSFSSCINNTALPYNSQELILRQYRIKLDA